MCMFHGDRLKRVQAYSGLGFKLCHLSDTPLTLEGWSSPAHRLPRSRRDSGQAGDRSTSPDQQSRREWTPPPDRAAVVPEAVPLPTPLRETLPAWYCPDSSACDGGRSFFVTPYRVSNVSKYTLPNSGPRSTRHSCGRRWTQIRSAIITDR